MAVLSRRLATGFLALGTFKADLYGILPWLYPLLMSLIAIMLIPDLTLWLPRTLGFVR